MPRPGTSNGVAASGNEPPEEENNLKRFLRQRKRRNVDSSYHSSHDKSAVAEIPRLQSAPPPNNIIDDDEDIRESPQMVMPNEEFLDEDFSRLKQGTAHLPDDIVLRILSFYEYDVDTTIAVAQQMKVPQLMPEHHEKFIVANIAMEKDLNPTKKMPYKEFYFKTMFQNSVDSKTLVDFYYKEKNKIGGNWRMEYEDPVETPEIKAEIEEKMKNAGIEIIVRDPSVTRQLRNAAQNASRNSSTRPTTHRTRRSEVERLKLDSDSEPSTSSGTPVPPPTSSDDTEPSTSSQPRINLRFRFTMTPNPNFSIINTPREGESSSRSTRNSSSAPRSSRPSTSEDVTSSETPRTTRSATRKSIDEQQPKRSPRKRKSTGSGGGSTD